MKTNKVSYFASFKVNGKWSHESVTLDQDFATVEEARQFCISQLEEMATKPRFYGKGSIDADKLNFKSRKYSKTFLINAK